MLELARRIGLGVDVGDLFELERPLQRDRVVLATPQEQRMALVAHQALECRGVTRADFRYDDSKAGLEGLFCLEVNTQPGMTETSLVPDMAVHAGISFEELVAWMVEDASLGR